MYLECRKVKDYAKRFLQGHWTFPGRGSEKKWYGESSYPPNGEFDSTVDKMEQRFKETGHLVFTIISALSCGIVKRKETIHFSGDSSNTELLFQTFHSVNQLSIYGAVPNWCEQFGLTDEEKARNNLSVNKSILTSVPSHEVQLLVSPPKLESGNSLQENILSFEALSDGIQFSKLCEDAWLKHRVSAGMMYKTRLDEDDGYGKLVPLRREYTLSRAHPKSRVFAAIPG